MLYFPRRGGPMALIPLNLLSGENGAAPGHQLHSNVSKEQEKLRRFSNMQTNKQKTKHVTASWSLFTKSLSLFKSTCTHTQTHTGTHACAHMCLIKMLSRLTPPQKENHVWYGQMIKWLFWKLDDTRVLKLIPSFMRYALHLYMQKTCYVSWVESKDTSETSPCASTRHRDETTTRTLT